ncbi:MAG: EAL domain-containing protein, partial [Gammaproteobacteria bacterium]
MGDMVKTADSAGAEIPLVLVVDDDPMIRMLVTRSLHKKGFAVTEAADGNAALAVLDNCQPDVILMDVLMPGMDGFQACEELRKTSQGEHVPVMMMTGLNDIGSIDHAFKVGATDFITKPLNFTILGYRIQYMLRTMEMFRNLRKSQAEVRHLAYYDSLTNLPNRRMFHDRLEQAVELGRRHEQLTGVLFIDVDNFKRINDSYGHTLGDKLLVTVASQLVNCLRISDSVGHQGREERREVSVARLGGDEFTVLLTNLERAEDAARVAKRVIDAIAVPFMLGSEEIVVTASIGIAVSPYDGDDVEELLKNADTAMFHAKEQGRNNYQFYTTSLGKLTSRRLSMESALRRALVQDEFKVYYQPKIDLKTCRASGLEALIRWDNPEMGMVSPADFIPLAEETDLIVPIGEWVLSTVCSQMRAWRDAGMEPLRVAVNLSARQFRQEDLKAKITAFLQHSGIESEWLELELTETAVMQDIQASSVLLNDLRKMGVKISMDDFGTGYSSLSMLKRLPLDTLKIDQSFVREVTEEQDNAAIVNAVITLGQSLRFRVVAEGVETQEQLELLQGLGCDEVQGYLFSRPLPAAG